jgi:hypothetical protein
MNSIRKLVGVGSGAAALCAMALVVASASVMAHGADQSAREAASARTQSAAEAAPSAACVAARQAIANARLDDRAEDSNEKLDAAADVNEDKLERAAMKALWETARTACGPQPDATEATEPAKSTTPPTDACVAAKTALKNAVVAWKANEASEKGTITEHSSADRQEDQAEFTQIKSLGQAAAAACGFGSGEHGFDRD